MSSLHSFDNRYSEIYIIPVLNAQTRILHWWHCGVGGILWGLPVYALRREHQRSSTKFLLDMPRLQRSALPSNDLVIFRSFNACWLLVSNSWISLWFWPPHLLERILLISRTKTLQESATAAYVGTAKDLLQQAPCTDEPSLLVHLHTTGILFVIWTLLSARFLFALSYYYTEVSSIAKLVISQFQVLQLIQYGSPWEASYCGICMNSWDTENCTAFICSIEYTFTCAVPDRLFSMAQACQITACISCMIAFSLA